MNNKPFDRKTLVVMAAALVVILATVVCIVVANGGQETFTGYLVCQDCGNAGACQTARLDLTAHPERHTLKCLRAPESVTSGYGIAIKQEDASWSGVRHDGGGYVFCLFDGKGSKLALENVVYKSSKTDNLLVDVEGTLDEKIGTMIHVESITEK